MADPLGQAAAAAALTARRAAHAMTFAATPNAVATALTPRDEIDRLGNFRLWRYGGEGARTGRPVLLVHSLISRPTIFDLSPGVSLVENLRRQGFDVFLADWGEPRATDRLLALEDYAGRLMQRAIDGACAASGAASVNLAAYCLGGTLSLLYAARHADPRVAGLALLATPVSFRDLGLFSRWTTEKLLDIDALVDTLELVPAAVIDRIFKALKPASDFGKYYGLMKGIDDPAYVEVFRAVDRWTNDHIPMAGAVARQLVVDLLREDRLAKGDMRLSGQLVDLAAIRCPVVNCIGAKDLIVPPSASAMLLGMLGGDDKSEIALSAGHMALLAGRDAPDKLWPALGVWLRARS